MSSFFQFEADFVYSLRCIPMQVRMKLDTCGVKLKLNHWNQLDPAERQTLVDLPCATSSEAETYRQYLQNLVKAKTGDFAGEFPIDTHPAWLEGSIIPAEVQEKAAEVQVNLTVQQWENLTPAQRFALIKLSRPSHENKNFFPALQEFELA